MPFKSFPEKEQLKCYPRYAIYSYEPSHCNLSAKPLCHFSPHDSSPVALWPSITGEYCKVRITADYEFTDSGVLVDADTIPCFPPSFVNPRLVRPIVIALHHHRRIASPCAHLHLIIDLAPQTSRRPSLQSPRV